MTPHEAYERLVSHGMDTSYLGSAVAVLHWDQRTHIPPRGHAHRVEQLASLAKMLYRRATDPLIPEMLGLVEGTDLTQVPTSVEAVNIREWRRSYDRISRIPERLAVASARAAAEGQAVWERARPRNDWDQFKPCLETIVSLKREIADALGYDREPYDALLDDYERGATAAGIETVFRELQPALVALLDRIKGSSRDVDPALRLLRFPVADQEAFALAAAREIGYDLDAGRLDVSAHPFTTGIGPGDVRITARYDERSFGEGFSAVIHETGHALYHQGLPMEHWGTPFCRPISLGVNESQSRMWENLVARSRSFWRYFYPLAMSRFPAVSSVAPDDFLLFVNEVVPSLIRTEADEVTYNLHVLLRFEIEVALMRGDLAVADLPDAWNEKMRAYLGLTPPDYAMGVMQDVHWSSGAIGYFPTYTLGNLMSAQFFASARRELGDLDAAFERGDFAALLAWLRERIHSQGTRYLPGDLVKTVTGEDLTATYLIDYLNRKYEDLYGL